MTFFFEKSKQTGWKPGSFLLVPTVSVGMLSGRSGVHIPPHVPK